MLSSIRYGLLRTRAACQQLLTIPNRLTSTDNHGFNKTVINFSHSNSGNKKDFEYTQGQSHTHLKVREYFYYLDHHGQLFLDDTKIKNFTSCYKEQKFLEFFFRNLRKNKTKCFEDFFPFVSACQGERNYLRCEDLPFVVTHLDETNDMVQLNQMNSAHWLFHFDPEHLYFNPANGRLYYLFENKEIIKPVNNKEVNDPKRLKHLDHMPCRIGLVKSDLNIYLMNKSTLVKSDNDKELYRFEYKGRKHQLKTMEDEHPCELLKKFSKHSHEI